ncbi:peptidoglycan recognition protein-like [Chelonus insularis]|uniref:peptidoglycan recognition protein-like n=1 Tax=Chelonus insularis TaxID=460826 RepID=UPI00158C2B68|nr:peptidoglycan recognition protein-like [Chelonus insularis]
MISVKFGCSVLVLFFFVTYVKAWEPLKVISFDKWNTGKILNKTEMISVPVHVMLSQTITEPCFSRDQCKDLLNSNSVSAIIPNFYVSGDGQIYAGHGWDSVGVVNFCTSDPKKMMIEISFIGDFENSKFSNKQLRAAQKLLEKGLLTGKLSETYDLFGDWQLIEEDFPMNENNKEIFKTWPHWASDLSQCTLLNDYNDIEDYEFKDYD